MSMIKQDRKSWENQYESGEWDFLSGSIEHVRYVVIADYIQRHQRPLSLLDVGCGEGLILKYINLDYIEKYTGLDFVQSALDKIQPRRKQDRYICSSLEEYSVDDKWDVILFNEVLYYTYDPVEQIKKFESALKEDGCFVISMHKKNRWRAYGDRCIRRLDKYFKRAHYTMRDSVELTRISESVSWRIYVVEPPSEKCR